MNNVEKELTQHYGEGRTLPHPVRFYRLALGLSRSELAARSGLHENTVANLEGRRHIPSAATVQKVADALGVPVVEVFPEFADYLDGEK